MSSKVLIFSFFLAFIATINSYATKGVPLEADVIEAFKPYFFNMSLALDWIENVAPVTNDNQKHELLEVMNNQVKQNVKDEMIEFINIVMTSFSEISKNKDLLYPIMDLLKNISELTDVDATTKQIKTTIDMMKSQNISSTLKKQLEAFEKRNNLSFLLIEVIRMWTTFDRILSPEKNETSTINNNMELDPKKNISTILITSVGTILCIICVFAIYLIHLVCKSFNYKASHKKNIVQT